ncbi:Transcriptional regulator of competence genes, TfoX/Sxy family [Klebsiella quasipneumoniae]|nr:Transcriptional regulator of competence genes, TfoX/Sxy family [Klebsiella quasipneumoniae]SCY96456.1 Transcriptional regulator of competence genes, TfoX/Sxy family [Klebsiella quasipneumoniae]SCZ70086.1 Transcriptional regulator of competence genes, TfoX/Sxy family [Klebsiella quasipneumoniae]SDB13169.1 Transcriptional regulator of competence genes, TfoX/Sxy family [Klebsiella quasipneumoniae]SEA99966.1 Transcriptional regulator of competence genes, TfoX/Sxy family [Klebsiella quasipneumoni
MRKLVCPRLPQFQACVSPLGQLHSRPLFGGYSLAIEDTVFAMVAEGNIYLKACEQSAAYRVEHHNPLLMLRRHGRIVPLKYYQIDDALWRDEKQLFRLSLMSWQSAQREKYRRRSSGRLKDITQYQLSYGIAADSLGHSRRVSATGGGRPPGLAKAAREQCFPIAQRLAGAGGGYRWRSCRRAPDATASGASGMGVCALMDNGYSV